MKFFAAYLFILSLTLAYACNQNSSTSTDKNKIVEWAVQNPQTVSLLGNSLRSPTPSAELRARYEAKYRDFVRDSSKIENIIWFGRFTAYMGDYVEAINIYSEGILQYPDEPQLYRHRGHRYITLRKFDKAIADLEKAKSLIQGTENEIEQDGMPNARNIPVSTLHGNIYYHLGLAYFLINDLPNALSSYQLCLDSSSGNDNVVSAVHWLYSISMRMNNPSLASEYLEQVASEMDIIENHSYYKLCLFYKGEMSREAILNPEESASANDAVLFGVANWHLVHGEIEDGLRMIQAIVAQDSWPSFGYIAAEAELARRGGVQ